MENSSTTRSVRSAPLVPGFMATSTPGSNPENGAGVYLLKWMGTKITKTNIDSVAQLRTCIQEDGDDSRQLLVFRGLPEDYELVLREATDIEPSFIDAHTGRRSYRQRKTRVKATWAHYDYPELIRALNDRRYTVTLNDLVSNPSTYKMPATSDSVMLCRASVWLSEKAHILFLDRAPWEDPTLGVSRGRYKAYIGKTVPNENGIPITWNEMDIHGNMVPLGDEIPSFETMLCENLREGCSGPEDLLELFEDLMLDKWSDFLEASSLDPSVFSTEIAPLFSHALVCLERNLNVSRRWRGARQQAVDTSQESHFLLDARPYPAKTEWEALLARLSRQTQLLSNLTTIAANPPSRRLSAIQAANGFGISAVKTSENKCDCKSKNKDDNNNCSYDNNANANRHHSTSAENQRALNRVAYLGGVLLPFSVVSGILAIEEPFGPGDAQFWIFWAVTVPLTLLTLGVIYADSIRKVQVWVEVAASGKGSSSGGSSHLDLGLGSSYELPQPDVEYAVPVTGRMAVPYSLSVNSVPAEAVLGAEGREGEENDGHAGGDEDEEPDMIVEKRWKKDSPAQQVNSGLDGDDWRKKKDIKWRKEELGWLGACATLFQVYKLKKGVPPRHLRHNDRRDRLRRVRTN
ncbi:hypothetical protein F5B22DRAFT_604425 [Xylaria bambusicola]|uniref:uncharacterized protein n=1 Tax=Xylaria bambusicola TaxID=326684 RepID=UPI002007AA4A|nr:uncharacterized protein F5B22DRAFT_604425 [Xylaria bambusicola]KAI0517388.1 hypothetical protein F5B22DRAFT_604425 [Xylaria bambusicola]